MAERKLLNEALTLARLYWGYSQQEMAAALGVSQSMVSDIERGAKSVSMDLLDRYSGALNVRKSQLLFFSEELESEEPPKKRGRLLVATKVLDLLQHLRPGGRDEAASA